MRGLGRFLLLAPVLVLAGCVGQGHAAPGPSPIPSVIVTPGWFSPYASLLGIQSSASEHAAAQAEIKWCMAQQGFQYLVRPYDPNENPLALKHMDSTFAAAYGYGAVSGSHLKPSEHEIIQANNQSILETLAIKKQNEWWIAYGRCAYSPSPSPGSIRAILLSKYWGFLKQAAEDPERVEAEKAWSNCMEKEGFVGFNTREQAASKYLDNPPPTNPKELLAWQDRQEQTALADIDCVYKTGYETVFDRVNTQYQLKFIKDNSRQLTEIRTKL